MRIASLLIFGCWVTLSVFAQEFAQEGNLPGDVIAFVNDAQAQRIHPPPKIIMSENKIAAWATARGFRYSADSDAGGWQFGRAAMLESNWYTFYLYATVDLRGERSKAGWQLVLDFASPSKIDSPKQTESDFSSYPALSLADIYVDGIKMAQIRTGYGQSFVSPLVIQIPLIRHPEGKVKIEIRMVNRPDNVLFLYDAFLTR